MCRPLLLFLIPLLLSLAACTGMPTGTGVVRDPDLHALMSQRIDVLLAQIDTLVLEQQRTELELEDERRRRAARIADAARVLQQTAGELPGLQGSLGLEPAEGQLFTSLALRLQEHGVELEALAAANRFTELPEAMTRTRGTCDACHRLYRDN